MRKQKDMEDAMMLAHREFVNNLMKSLDIIRDELDEADEMADICTDEWCSSTEMAIDDIHKQIYCISEPRFATEDDSHKLKKLRDMVKNLYVNFHGMSSQKKAA